MVLVGAIWGTSSHGSYFYIKNIREDLNMKKNKIYAHKLYSPKDMAKRTGIEEEKIIALLEDKKTIGKKMGNFWFIRGREILEINKRLKEIKSNE